MRKRGSPFLVVAAWVALAGSARASDTPGDLLTEPEYGDRAGAFRPFQPRVDLLAWLRARGTLAHQHALGHSPGTDPADPFSRWAPPEALVPPAGGCDGGCAPGPFAWADSKLRLQPSFVVSEVVALHVTLDALDGRLAGSRPAPVTGGGSVWGTTQAAAPLGVTHAYAELSRGGDLFLRFGRQPVHFGLGLVEHAGLGLDDDLGTALDRVELELRAGGKLRAAVAFDTGESGGAVGPRAGLVRDASERDDLNQLTVRLAWQHDREQRLARLEGGQAVLDLGVQWLHRFQELRATDTGLERAGARAQLLDGWLALRAGDLRLEAEAALLWGAVRPRTVPGTLLRGYGAALETEIDPQAPGPRVRLGAGLASGDPDASGLHLESDPRAEGSRSGSFRFHPAYRVDQILWRTLFGTVTGATYVKPGVSWVVTRSDYGELFELMADVVWSRALYAAETPGHDRDLGLEVDLAVRWRSVDGPREDDGYQLLVQYGVLFPFEGLGYRAGAAPAGFSPEVAHQIRALLGVVY